MGLKKSELGREQLDRVLVGAGALVAIQRPLKGWLRAIREGLGMTGVQMARRLHARQPRIIEMEKGELAGALTLKTLERAAEALNCSLVYALVPKAGSLAMTIREQAKLAARKRRKHAAYSMQLEDQGLTVREEAGILDAVSEDAVRHPPRWLWD